MSSISKFLSGCLILTSLTSTLACGPNFETLQINNVSEREQPDLHDREPEKIALQEDKFCKELGGNLTDYTSEGSNCVIELWELHRAAQEAGFPVFINEDQTGHEGIAPVYATCRYFGGLIHSASTVCSVNKFILFNEFQRVKGSL